MCTTAFLVISKNGPAGFSQKDCAVNRAVNRCQMPLPDLVAGSLQRRRRRQLSCRRRRRLLP